VPKARCVRHDTTTALQARKAANGLYAMHKSMQPGAREHLHDIWQAETTADAGAAVAFQSGIGAFKHAGRNRKGRLGRSGTMPSFWPSEVSRPNTGNHQDNEPDRPFAAEREGPETA